MRSKLDDIEIKKARVEDLDGVYEIENQSFPFPWKKEIFEDEFKTSISNIYLAKSQQEILGFIIFWIVRGEMHILNIAVHPDQRKNGIGKKLIEFSEKFAKERGVKYCLLEVRESNKTAQKFYEKFSYEFLYKRAKYYEDGEDAIVLQKTLT